MAPVDDEDGHQGVEGEYGQAPGAGPAAGQQEQSQPRGQRGQTLEPQAEGQGGPGPQGAGGGGDGQEGGPVGGAGVPPLHGHAVDDRVTVLGRRVDVGTLVVGDEDPAVGGVAPQVARPLRRQRHRHRQGHGAGGHDHPGPQPPGPPLAHDDDSASEDGAGEDEGAGSRLGGLPQEQGHHRPRRRGEEGEPGHGRPTRRWEEPSGPALSRSQAPEVEQVRESTTGPGQAGRLPVRLVLRRLPRRP